MNIKGLLYKAERGDYCEVCRLLATHSENQRNELMLLNARYNQMRNEFILVLKYLELADNGKHREALNKIREGHNE